MIEATYKLKKLNMNVNSDVRVRKNFLSHMHESDMHENVNYIFAEMSRRLTFDNITNN